MTVIEKIEEAEFYLYLIRNANQQGKEILYYISAFLASTRSIFDYLLWDYAAKYQLGIRLDDKTPTHIIFKRLAPINPDAVKFFNWYESRVPYYCNLTYCIMRNIEIHKTRPPMLFRRYIEEAVDYSAKLVVVEKNRPIIKRIKDIFTKIFREKRYITKQNAHQKKEILYLEFSDFPGESVVQVCEKFLQIMKDFVKEALRNFP